MALAHCLEHLNSASSPRDFAYFHIEGVTVIAYKPLYCSAEFIYSLPHKSISFLIDSVAECSLRLCSCMENSSKTSAA